MLFTGNDHKDFPKSEVAAVAKLKSAHEDQLVQTIILHLSENGRTIIQLTNHSDENWKIKQDKMLGCLDMRSSGYVHVSRDILQQKIKSFFKDNCLFLIETETNEYFDLSNIDHTEVMNYVNSQVNHRLKQQQGNTKLIDKNEHLDENDINIVPDRGKDPYPWLDKGDHRRHTTDQEIL